MKHLTKIPAALGVAFLLAACGSEAPDPQTMEPALPVEPDEAPVLEVAERPVSPLSPPLEPDEIPWVTNTDDPPIGDPAAIRGGTLRLAFPSYPQTFRLVGPNANEMFAGWNRLTSIDFGLVWRHPTTDNFIPMLATHWYVADDNRTVYYKLDPNVRWSDGQPITADDYVFTYEFLRDPRIRDPFYASYMEQYFEDVQKVSDDVIKIIGKQESWRPLSDFSLSPYPKHAIELSDTWVDDANYVPPVVAGPYTITDWRTNESVTFSRVQDWWGDGHHYLQGMYNPDRVVLRIIQDDDRQFDHFRRNQIDYYEVYRAQRWAEEINFEAIQKGWARARMVFVESPEGMSGLGMNLQRPVFQNKDFRKGLQHLFDFETLNSRLMYNAYYRKVSAFHGTEFANPDLVPYEFNPARAQEYFTRAGFTQRNREGILVNDAGQLARFNLIYASRTMEPHLTTIQNIYRRGGVDIRLQLLEPGTMFNRVRENATEMFTVSMTGGFYPAPHQYFHSEFKDEPQTNNFWNFGTPETDELIETYMFSMDEQERIEAMHKLDEIIRDEAFYISFWSAPYMRFLYYDYIEFPEFYYPRRATRITDAMVLWINPDKQREVEEAMRAGRDIGGEKGIVEVDPYGVRERLESH